MVDALGWSRACGCRSGVKCRTAAWAAFPDQSGYPTKFYQSLTVDPGSSNVHPPKDFIPMAKAGTLPQVCYVWSPAGYDEHPPHVNDPT